MWIQLILLALLVFTTVRSQEGCWAVPDCNCSLRDYTDMFDVYWKDGFYLNYDCMNSGLSVVPNFTDNAAVINLSENKIINLHEDTFAKYTELQRIFLQDNIIGILPEKIFAANVELLTIELKGNQIQSLPETIFAKNVELWYIDLGENQIQRLSENIFANNVNVIWLYLNENQIQSLPENIFENNVALWGIELQGNQIHSLPENIFAKNVVLEALMLNANQIQSLPEKLFANNIILEKIMLHGNQIQSLSGKIFVNNIKLLYITMSFNCNCLEGSVYNFALLYYNEYDENTLYCIDASEDIHVRFEEVSVENCTDSSLITLYNSSFDRKHCPCDETTSNEGLEEKTTDSTESKSRVAPTVSSERTTERVSLTKPYVGISTSLGVVAGVATVMVILSNLKSKNISLRDIKKKPEMKNKETENQLKIWMENCEFDFAAVDEADKREMIILEISNMPPASHLKTFSTSV